MEHDNFEPALKVNDGDKLVAVFRVGYSDPAEEEGKMNKNEEREKKRTLYASKWEEIFVGLHTQLTAFAMGYTNGNNYAAEDLVQDTIYRVILYSPDPAKINNPWAYLVRTLRSLWIDRWKKVKGLQMQSLDDADNEALRKEIPGVQPTVLRDLENEDLRRELRIASGNLKPIEKDVFKLFLEGYDCKEIAEILNKDPYLVSYSLNAVRAKIRYRVNKIRGKRD